MRLRVVEPLFYQYPPAQELLAEHPVMKGVWREAVRLAHSGAMLAPLLVDDRSRSDAIAEQTLDHLLWVAARANYSSLPWFGPSISEAELQARYGDVGCKALDALYHLQVISEIKAVADDWEWIVVHPESFHDQQAGMLEDLWKHRIASPIDWQALARAQGRKVDVLRAEARDLLLSRFSHRWVGQDGHVIGTTRPVWRNKRVVHIGENEAVQELPAVAP